MLETQDLSFSYGKKAVLHALSLRFAPGTLTGIIGPNGCGKSTLLRLLAGQSNPQSGACLLDERPFATWERRAFARQLSYFPQTRPVPDLTVAELVLCGRYPHGTLFSRPSANDQAAVDEALAATDLTALAHRNLQTLSGGEQQRAYLALLLAQQSSVVLLDEPTAHLDLPHQLLLMRRLQALRDAGKCVVVVLHELSLALDYCDRILALENGRIVADGTPEEVANSDTVSGLFGVFPKKIKTPEGTGYLLIPR
ncbi:MAG: ABC transporter ATP-binding protein [Clostridia bacterium]|nr:ABC transporter ATP-binding protein [Clostridia bacterium]MBQ8340310.1 ABC transporter ATP-binding protein [Clostridia bacterium]